jgi:hypothetical protein
MRGEAMLLLLILLFAGGLGQSMSISLVTADNVTVNMFSSNQYNTYFIQQSAPFNCSLSDLYTYAQSSGQYLANAPYIIQFANVTSTLQFTLKSIYQNKFTPTLSAGSCSNTETCNITVRNNCPS